jgi:hypothetical protein
MAVEACPECGRLTRVYADAGERNHNPGCSMAKRWRRGEQPWVDPETKGTLVDPWLAAYAQDDNVYWATETGHIQNVLDEVLTRLEFKEQQLQSANETLMALAKEVFELRAANPEIP